MSSEDHFLQCYNRGCGEKYDPANNNEDSCRHHPGLPFFHDAYKGWSCCNKKCTDFTEFLNIKGCTQSIHSNVKQPEPEKPKVQEYNEKEIVEIKPMIQPVIIRPPIDIPMTTLKPDIAPSLKQQLEQIAATNVTEVLSKDSNEVTVGTPCKNGGCSISYDGPQTDETTCIYHSGAPIFHEGLKYWSCCQRKTTDFNAFLNQAGCNTGKHLWKKEETNDKVVECRWDWHQTGTHVVLSIYAKQYCPTMSIVQLNPIRLFTNIVFPQLSNATFTLDIELQGIIDVKASQASMYGTKIEIKMKKGEPGSWSKIEIPKKASGEPAKLKEKPKVEDLAPDMDAVDLSDL